MALGGAEDDESEHAGSCGGEATLAHGAEANNRRVEWAADVARSVDGERPRRPHRKKAIIPRPFGVFAGRLGPPADLC
jgi:hypothetical protein